MSRSNYRKLALLIFALTLFVACDTSKQPGRTVENGVKTVNNQDEKHAKEVSQPDSSETPTTELADENAAVATSSGHAEASPANDATRLALRMLAWNVESEGADSDVISSQLADFNGYDLYGLTEVMPEDIRKFKDAAGPDYRFIFSNTGRNDRMQLIYNSNRLDLISKFELHDMNPGYRYRSPLVGHFRHMESGTELMIMINHLARGKAEMRQQQASQLVEWARGKSIPIIALGDYNFDFEFSTKTGNDAFRLFLRDNVWRWVEPSEFIDTNWFDPEPDGLDNYPGSMLDFAFLGGSAMTWKAECNIIVREGDFPDDETTSDHRPYELIVSEP